MGLFFGEGALLVLIKQWKGTILVFNWKVKQAEIKLDFLSSINLQNESIITEMATAGKAIYGSQPSLILSIYFPLFVVILCFSWVSRDSFWLEKRISIPACPLGGCPATITTFPQIRSSVSFNDQGRTTKIIYFGKHENEQSNNVWVRV